MNIRELDKWPDVVIVSTQGKRSIASLLADGGMLNIFQGPSTFDDVVVTLQIWTEVHFLLQISNLL